MQRARDEIFAGTGFAFNQHGLPIGTQLGDGLENFAQFFGHHDHIADVLGAFGELLHRDPFLGVTVRKCLRI